MQARRLIIGYLFYTCLSVWVVYIYGFSSLSNLWAPLLGYYIVTYLLHLLWCKIRRTIAKDLITFFILFVYKTAIYLSIALLSIGAFLYYQNNISPAQLPAYSISNGTQAVVFQTMSHIGSESFYAAVAQRVHQNKKSGGVLYYEWVLPGSEENNKQFNAALWIEFAPWLYDNFSKLYGVQAQDNNDFLWLVNNLDYNIDLNLDQVMDLYREKIWSGDIEWGWLLASSGALNINQEVISRLSELWDKELQILQYVNQWMLNFMIKHEALREFLISKLANQDIFSVILDDRNRHIANEILTRGDEKIIILYGLMHFEWVLQLLQEHDNSWEIYNTSYQQIITR